MAIRPIDANAMLNELKPLGFEAEHSAVLLSDVSKMMREWVESQPTLPAADVVEVRHGRWGEYESFPLTSSLNGHPCSECGMHFSTLAIPVMKYCPNCGARMDKEAEHEAD